MFGDEKLYGQSEQIIDSNQRIFLASATKREEGDELLLIKDKDLNVYRICREDNINRIFYNINKKLSESETEEEKLKYKKEIYDLSKTILKTLKVDKAGRVALGETFIGITKVNVIGANDHLILELKK